MIARRAIALGVGALLGAAGCAAPPCQDGTVRVTLTLTGEAVKADQIVFSVSANGSGFSGGDNGRSPGGSDTVVLRFAAGYPHDQTIKLRVVALEKGVEVGEGSTTVTLSSACEAVALPVGPLAGDGGADAAAMDLAADGGVVDAAARDGRARDLAVGDGAAIDAAADARGIDAATPDSSAPDSPPLDLTTPDLATRDLATPDLAVPDLATPDLAVPPDLSMRDSSVASDLSMPPDLSVPPDLLVDDLSIGAGDMATLPATWTFSGAPIGLGGGVSSSKLFILEGAIGAPGPGSVCKGGNFSFAPIVPGREEP